MTNHTCGCKVCAADQLPEALFSLPPDGPNHYGVRFGHGRGYRPSLNGVDVIMAFEAMTGKQGWIATWSLDPEGSVHECDCGLLNAAGNRELCIRVLYGHVDIRRGK